MRIVCETVNDFIIHIKETPVHLNTIYVNKTVHSATNEPVRKAMKTSVGIQVSAVLCFEDDSQSLIEAGETLGNDYHTSDASKEGTELFDAYMQDLYNVCNEKGLKIRPGLLGL